VMMPAYYLTVAAIVSLVAMAMMKETAPRIVRARAAAARAASRSSV